MRLILIVLSASILMASAAYSEITTDYRYDDRNNMKTCTTVCSEGVCSTYCY